MGVSEPATTPITHLAARDGFLLAVGHELRVLDARSTGSLPELATVPLDGPADDVAWFGSEAWLIVQGKLHRIDLRSPEHARRMTPWEAPAVPGSAPPRLTVVAPLAERAVLLTQHPSDGDVGRPSTTVLVVERTGDGGLQVVDAQYIPLPAQRMTAGADRVVVQLAGGRLDELPLSEDGQLGRRAALPDVPAADGDRDLRLLGQELWHLGVHGVLHVLPPDARRCSRHHRGYATWSPPRMCPDHGHPRPRHGGPRRARSWLSRATGCG